MQYLQGDALTNYTYVKKDATTDTKLTQASKLRNPDSEIIKFFAGI